MTKTTIFISSMFIILLVSSGYAYWMSSAVTNKVYLHINEVDLSLYAHRGVVKTTSLDRTALVVKEIAKIDERFGNGERLVALANYQALLEQDPSNMELLLRIGIVYLQEKEYALAEENLSTVYGFIAKAFHIG